MAAKREEVSALLAEASAPVAGAISEKQSEPAPIATNAEPAAESKAVEGITAGLAGVSVLDTKDPEKKIEEAIAPDNVAPTAPADAPKDNPATVVAPAPAGDANATTGPVWPETDAEHPLTKFFDEFEILVKEAGHNEVYGIELAKSNAFHTKLILQKFLRANQNDLVKAKEQLIETLKWRKAFDPVKAATSESFEKAKFGGLGYVLEVEGVPESPNKKDIVTFNIYGSVKDNKATFGDLDAFLRWRVGLMEKSVQKLNLSSATEPIPNFGEGPDPYQGFQIHDYLQVSFLRQDPVVKAATKKTIETLGRHYPETLSRKFFVNVPIVMGWIYTAMKMVVAKETAKKFTVLSYGNQLVAELGPNIPKVYGGNTEELAEVSEGMKFVEDKQEA